MDWETGLIKHLGAKWGPAKVQKLKVGVIRYAETLLLRVLQKSSLKTR